MALKVSYTTPQGFECPEAYIMISAVSYQKSGTGAARYLLFKDQTSRLDGKTEIGSADFGFAYDLQGDNIIKQAYEALKQRPEMLGAVDA